MKDSVARRGAIGGLFLAAVVIWCHCGTATQNGSATTTASGPSDTPGAANGSLSGVVAAAIVNAPISLVPATTGSGLLLELSAPFSPPGGALQVSSPTRVTAALLESTIGFSSTPSPGTYTQSSSQVCGAVAFTYATESTKGAFSAQSTRTCSGSALPALGSWSLTLSKVATQATNGVFSVSGSLTATMSDGESLALSF